MVTPREHRFVELAVQQGNMTPAQAETIIEFQTQKRSEGQAIPLWDSAVLNNALDAGVAEELREEAGELDIEKLDEFTLVRKLGQGGMGSVWLARTPGNENVAAKVLDPSLASQRTFVTRFLREAQVSMKLQHDNIVRGIRAGEAAGHYYFVMEFIEGGSARAVIDKETRFTAQRASEIILEVAEALAYAHENGVVHRDLKPDNIMLTSAGHAKVADLGLARMVDDTLTFLTGTGTSMGTPFYMPPEQGRDAKRADSRSDIYALGATWYHMIVGEPPFTGSSPVEVMRKHEQEAIRWPTEFRGQALKGVTLTIERMMAKDPDTRIQTMQELARVIKEQCLGERDILKDLGVKKGEAEKQVWQLKVKRDGVVKELDVPHEKLREMIRRGQVSREMPVRPAGSDKPYKPVKEIRALAGALPRGGPAAPTVVEEPLKGKKGLKKKRDKKAPATLHDLVANYDQYERGHRRTKKLKKLGKVLLRLIIIAAFLFGLYMAYKHFGPGIIESIKSSREAEPAEGRS